MKKTAVVFFYIACSVGLMVGIMHFFAPYSFKWYSYIPNAPKEIYQSINYINFCFSFLLAGISILLIIVQKQLFEGQKELKIFYAFYVLVWLSRVIIQIIWAWPSSLQIWLVVAFTLELVFALVPLTYFFLTAKKCIIPTIRPTLQAI